MRFGKLGALLLAGASTAFASTIVGAQATTPSTTTLSPNQTTTYTSGSNSTVTLTANVTSGATGTVTFKDGSTNLTCSGGNPAALSAGSAVCSTSLAAEGLHVLSATYGGDSTYLTSSGSTNVYAKNHATNPSGAIYCNPGAVATNGLSNNAYSNTTPYPSTLTIGDGTPGVGTVNTLSLQLTGFSSASGALSNVHMLLVAPDSSRAFEFFSSIGTTASNGNYVFQDAATAVPTGPISPGTYGPTAANTTTDSFTPQAPLPAPQLPATFSAAAPFGSSTFQSVFDGTAGNGDWKLYVYNGAGSGNTASIIGGWCLSFNSGPVVTTNPTDQTVNAGQTATFTAAASGTPTPTVQWQFSTDGGATFQNVAGAITTTLTVPNVAAGQNGTKFRAVFTNTSGSATTTAATMTVNFAPTVTTNPSSQSVSAGSTATFTAAANGNPTPTVQWQQSTNGGATFTNIAGATSTTLSFTTLISQNGNQYRAVFTNTVGSATTTAATLTVTAGPVITQNPTDQTVNAGQTATFTAAATGTPTPTVQWQFSTDGGATFQNVAGAITTTLTVPNVAAGQNGTKFRAVFTNTSGSATTTAATMTVNFAPTVTTNPSSQSVSAGSTATFTAAANGNPTPTVQWQQSTNGGATFTNIAGATSTTLSFTALASQNGNQYRAVFTNTVGSATTTAATLTVTAGPVITQNPTDQTVNAGQTATFTAAATGTPTPTVQWQFSTDGGATFQNVAGAITTTLTVPNVAAGQNGTKFRAVFTNTSGSATTTVATMTVNFAPTVTTNPSSQSVSAGSTATFTAAANGNPTPTVQWQQSTNGGATFTNIAGATSTTLSFTALASQNGNQYRAVFTNTVGSATTTAATLTVTVGPVITQNPTDQTVNAGQTATFTAAASGTPTPTVQWQFSADGGATFSNVAGATTTTLTVPNVAAGQNGTKFRAVFTNPSGSATTTAATMTVNFAPTVTTNPTSQSVSAGGVVTFTAAANGNPTPTVQWQQSTNGGATFTNIAGATSTTLSFTALASQNGNQYRAVFTNTVGSATTTAATLTVTSSGTAQMITFGAAPSVFVGGTGMVTASTSATPSASYPITFSTASTACSVGAATGIVTGIHAGTNTCTITASQAGDATYAPASANQTLSIAMASQAITAFMATPASPAFSVGGTFTVSANGGASGNAVVFTIAAGSNGVCSAGGANGATVMMLSGGTCTVLADQAGNADYAAAAQATLAVTISQATSSMTLTATPNPATQGAPVTFSATVNAATPASVSLKHDSGVQALRESNAVIAATGSISFADGSTLLATVPLAGGTASYTTAALSLGTHTITATYAGDVDTAPATNSITLTVNVAPVPPVAAPVASSWMLAGLAGLIALIGAMLVRRSSRA